MPSKTEKNRRKQLKNELSAKATHDFERSLPMSRHNFQQLFDHLDISLNDNGCDDTTVLTSAFLWQSNIENVDVVLAWLAANGGHCDCEILANVEEQFEKFL